MLEKEIFVFENISSISLEVPKNWAYFDHMDPPIAHLHRYISTVDLTLWNRAAVLLNKRSNDVLYRQVSAIIMLHSKR